VRTHLGEAELICGEDLFMHQFVKDLQRHFIVRRCAGHDIAGTFPVKGVKQFPLAGSLPLTGKYARFTRLKRYIGVGNFVIQSVRFRFGHSCHFSLLKIKRGNKFLSARHSMKYINSPVVDDIIRRFKQVSGSIIPDKQPFVFMAFEQLLMERVQHRVTDIAFADAVFEGGFIELDVKFHASL
jgi:hypothetical protein